MQNADESTDDATAARSSRNPISAAILAAVACVPIVVAAGFLTDRGPDASTAAAVPGDITALALRGGLDTAPERRPDLPMRAGY